ncbi:hypothetical protein F4810DRAFT_428751 [Camillea tinctor]|nr:hypothetical protein F4810DRAFT_428751 [Camillea tinctor]
MYGYDTPRSLGPQTPLLRGFPHVLFPYYFLLPFLVVSMYGLGYSTYFLYLFYFYALTTGHIYLYFSIFYRQ